MALDREVELRQIGPLVKAPQAGVAALAEKIWEHAMVRATATGYLCKVGDSTVTGVGPVLGVARFTVDNSAGADGEKSLDIYHGVFSRPNSATAAVTWASFGKAVYAEDDEVITSDPAYPVAGTMWGFRPDGEVIFAIDPGNTGLAAAAIGMLTLPVAGFFELDGAPLAAFADGDSPTPGLSFNDSKCAAIRYNNHATPDGIATSVALPDDLDDTQDAYVIIAAAKTGATLNDTATLNVGAFFQTVGALYDAGVDAGDSANALDGDAAAKTVQIAEVTIAAANIPSGVNRSLTLTIEPEAGELGTDDLLIISVRFLYRRKV